MEHFPFSYSIQPNQANSLQASIRKLGTIGFYKTGKLLLCPAEQLDKIFFIRKGLVHIYQLNGAARKTYWFAQGGDILCCLNHFLNQETGNLYVEALDYTEALVLKSEHISVLMAQKDKNMEFTRMITEYFNRVHRFYSHITGLAAERYATFLDRFPGIENKAPLNAIASLLNISTKTLGRMRATKRRLVCPAGF